MAVPLPCWSFVLCLLFSTMHEYGHGARNLLDGAENKQIQLEQPLVQDLNLNDKLSSSTLDKHDHLDMTVGESKIGAFGQVLRDESEAGAFAYNHGQILEDESRAGVFDYNFRQVLGDESRAGVFDYNFRQVLGDESRAGTFAYNHGQMLEDESRAGAFNYNFRQVLGDESRAGAFVYNHGQILEDESKARVFDYNHRQALGDESKAGVFDYNHRQALGDESKAGTFDYNHGQALGDESKARAFEYNHGQVLEDESRAGAFVYNRGQVLGDESKARAFEYNHGQVLKDESKAGILLYNHEQILGNKLSAGAFAYNHKQVDESNNAWIHSHLKAHDGNQNPGFFKFDELLVGKRFTFLFYFNEISSLTLPKKAADSIPFKLSELRNILQLLSIPQGSSLARRMKMTLRMCESGPVEGETKACLTSLESLQEFVQEAFGPGNDFKVLVTVVPGTPTSTVLNFTVLDAPKEIESFRYVNCHSLPYAYAIFFCHHDKSGTRAFQVSLGLDNGGKAEALAVCHEDTSDWDPRHVSFQILKSKPGEEVCHFLPPSSFLWVQSITAKASAI